MVWPIAGAESYVCETDKSMKGAELAGISKGDWRNIAIPLTDPSPSRFANAYCRSIDPLILFVVFLV